MVCEPTLSVLNLSVAWLLDSVAGVSEQLRNATPVFGWS
jgi:hypothetical protein